MALLLISVYLKSLKTKSKENISIKLIYLIKTIIEAFSTIKPTI